MMSRTGSSDDAPDGSDERAIVCSYHTGPGWRITLHCTELSGRVIPVSFNDTDTLGECIRQLTFGECAGSCLDDHGRIKARIRLITVSGQLVVCCRGPLQYGLRDGDSLSIIYESVRDLRRPYESYTRPYCEGCDAAVDLRARRRTVEPDDAKSLTKEQLKKLFADWEQEFIQTTPIVRSLCQETQHSAFGAFLRKFFGGRPVVISFWWSVLEVCTECNSCLKVCT